MNSLTPEGLAADKALLIQARNDLPLVHFRATAPASLDGLKAVLEPAFALYPQTERTPEEWAAWWAAYVQSCGQQSTASLAAAMRAWVSGKDNTRLPMPGQLLDLAKHTPTPAAMAHNTIRLAIAIADAAERDRYDGVIRRAEVAFRRDPPEVRGPVMEAYRRDKERSAQQKAEVSASKRQALPPITGELVEGHHVTKALMAHRREMERLGRVDD